MTLARIDARATEKGSLLPTRPLTHLWGHDADGVGKMQTSEFAAHDQRATIERKTTASYGGIIYDVITATGGPGVVVKKYGPDVDSGGVMLRRTAKEAAKLLGYPVAINCDRGTTPTGDSWGGSASGINRGLQIVDGIAYRDWQEGTSQTEAIVMMNDGSWEFAYKTDGKTAQQWVDEGALWSVGGFAILVKEGVPQDLTGWDGDFTVLSARTILGRKSNGDFVILLVEGDSGVYGIGGTNMRDLAIAEGCQSAIVLDGGGSSQCWWGNSYAMPSNDTTDPFLTAGDAGRKVVGWLCLDVPSVQEYDSGRMELTPSTGFTGSAGVAALWVRQKGPRIFVGINGSASPALGTAVDFLLSSTNLPPRYYGVNANSMRGMVMGQQAAAGGAAWDVPVLVSGSGALTLRTGSALAPAPATISAIVGNWSFYHRWA